MNTRPIHKLISLTVTLSVLVAALLAAPVHSALAANTGFLNPTLSASASGFTALTNPNNAFADDANNATGTFVSGTTLGEQYFGYGASIPAGAVLQGIEVRVDYWMTNSAGTNTLTVDLSTDGSTWTGVTDQDTSEPTTQATFIAGSTTELWGRTWTAADLSNLRVRVRMATTSSTSRTFNLDWVSVRLTYNRTPNTPTNTAPANGALVAAANPTFTWTAFSDPDAGDAQNQFHIQLRQNPGNYSPAFREFTSGTSTANTYTPTTWNLSDGNYCWQVQVRDNSGASNAYSNYSAETCFTEDGNPPTSSATSPAYATASPFTVSVTNAADAGSGVAYVQLYARVSTGNWALVSQINAPGPYQWSYAPGANGTYYFQSRACDNAINCEAQPSGSTGTGDSTTVYDNVAPTSAATPPAGPINAAPIAIPWTASDATSGIAANGVALWVKTPGGGSFVATGLTSSGTAGSSPTFHSN